MTLQKHKVRVIQEGNWKYQGQVIEENEQHITILDQHTGRKVTLRKDTLLVLEVLE